MWGNPHKGNFKSDNMDNFDIFYVISAQVGVKTAEKHSFSM